jgi:hypothetical protein
VQQAALHRPPRRLQQPRRVRERLRASAVRHQCRGQPDGRCFRAVHQPARRLHRSVPRVPTEGHLDPGATNEDAAHAAIHRPSSLSRRPLTPPTPAEHPPQRPRPDPDPTPLCIQVDSTGVVIAEAAKHNQIVFAKCICTDAWSGNDCSMPPLPPPTVEPWPDPYAAFGAAPGRRASWESLSLALGLAAGAAWLLRAE